MVSGPTNFTHNVHVGFDPMNGIFTVSIFKMFKNSLIII